MLASTSEEAGSPIGTSMIRFSTVPEAKTRTTNARPGPRETNSMCFKGSSTLGATTRPAQCDRSESTPEASSSISDRLLPEAAHSASMRSRSSLVRLPCSSSP